MNNSFEGKVVYITGGTRGIGRALAEHFLRMGATVGITGREPSKADDLRSQFSPSQLLIIRSDATILDEINNSMTEVEAAFGPIDICILNAGGVRDSAPVIDMTDDEWEFEFNINIHHVFRGTRRALQTMIPRQSGRIIAVSSIEGKHGKARLSGYTANKHAINGFVKAAAQEVGTQGIAITAICPGLVLTDALVNSAGKNSGAGSLEGVIELYTKEAAIKRMVTLDEICGLVELLAGPAGMAFAGGTISVDGGHAFY
ncbi:MAG: SDR family NAD(P)-dependent oxidoreductase [Actinomycetota bacterium]